MSSRRRPLHTCAVSFLAIAHKTSQKAREHNGPIGTFAKRSAILGTLASPIFSALQCLILATLVLVDDYLLACEDNLVSIYPPSNCVFNKVDELARVVETLPGKFDGFWGEFPECVSRVPFLERVLMSVVAWLNFLLSGLVGSGSGSGKNEEEEIAVNEDYMKSNEDYSVMRPAKVVGEMAERKKVSVKEPSHWEENKEITAENPPHEKKEINVNEENYMKNIEDYSIVGPIRESPHKREEKEKVAEKVVSEMTETSSSTKKEDIAQELPHGKENEKIPEEKVLHGKKNEEIPEGKVPHEKENEEIPEEKVPHEKENEEIPEEKVPHEKENEEIPEEKVTREENNELEEEDIAKESSYETDATEGSVYEEVMPSLKDDQSIGAPESSNETLDRENNGNIARKGENGSNVKPGLAEEWFESGWAVKPKQAPKRKQKSKKKKN